MKYILAPLRLFSVLLVFSLTLCFFVPCSFAEEKNPDALYEEGMRLFLNTGDPQDVVKGIILIGTAANSGSAKAMVELGRMYTNGLGKVLTEDFVEGSEAELALSWYVKGAEAGEKEAAASAISSDAFSYFLGSEDGSIQENDAVALKYFMTAADYGDPSATNMMVAFYIYGFGVEQNPDKALELSSNLIDQGDNEALISLEEYAYAYYSGNKDGIDINFSNAFKFYDKLTEYGNERAMYNVGLLYEYGLGVSQDHTKAVEWLTKAQEAGYEPAKAMLTELTATKATN